MATEDELLVRQVPHSVEAEQAVLGSILIDAACVPKVVAALRPEDFYMPQNRDLFETIVSMFNFSERIDPVTVLNKLKQRADYDDDSAYKYLKDLMLITPTSANVGEYAAIVKDKSELRRLLTASESISALVQEGTATAGEALEIAEQRIYDIRGGRNTEGMEPVNQVILSVYARLNELSQRDSAFPGIPTGLTDLDNAIAGLNDSDLILLAARPGMGKTSLALNILLHAAKASSKAIAFFSLEMSKVQLGMRLLSQESFVPNRRLVTGRLLDSDWDKLATAAENLGKTRIYIDDNPLLSVTDMKARCRQIDDLGLIIIDYLQLMTSAGDDMRSGENRQQIVSNISRAMKIMAKELNVPVLCLSQLSRANESRSDKRPMLSDLRESGAIEQDADIVLFLYRDSYYNTGSEEEEENQAERNMTECSIAKNRHGETGVVKLQWIPEYTTFTSLDRTHEEY